MFYANEMVRLPDSPVIKTLNVGWAEKVSAPPTKQFNKQVYQDSNVPQLIC